MTGLNTDFFETAQKSLQRELFEAIIANKTEAVKALLERGVDPHGEYEYYLPLVMAAGRGCTGIVDLLLDWGANINSKTTAGNTALILAAAMGEIAVVRRLIERGAALDITSGSGDTALMRAVMKGHADIVRLLIENFADATKENYFGWTPLAWAENQSLILSQEGKAHDVYDAIAKMLKDALEQQRGRQAADRRQRMKAKAGSRRREFYSRLN